MTTPEIVKAAASQDFSDALSTVSELCELPPLDLAPETTAALEVFWRGLTVTARYEWLVNFVTKTRLKLRASSLSVDGVMSALLSDTSTSA